MNNNVTVALTCADMIERVRVDRGQAELLCASISEACSNAAALTRQLLTLGRRDISQPELVCLPVDPRQLEQVLINLLLRRGHYPGLAKPFSEAQLLESVSRALAPS